MAFSPSRLIHDWETPHGAVILMYHAIQRCNKPDWPYAVSLAAFRRQLDFLREAGYATPTVSELVADPARFGGRTAVITFDDGYVDNLDAWDALKERGMRATWYVTSDYIGSEHPWREPGQPRGRLLSAEELRQMADSGMEIGSHTLSHPHLPALDDLEISRQVSESKARLEAILERPVVTFAYPYGQWDERCERHVKAAGYSSACLTRTGWALRDKNPYRLRRLTIYNSDSLGRFIRKLALASHEVSWLKLVRVGLRRALARE